jgi:two-component system, sensor histidine kinase and response regulator
LANLKDSSSALSNISACECLKIFGRGKDLQILLAEDNAVNQLLTTRLLEKRGYKVVVANNGREAVTALAAQQFDLVLMDIQMPEMDGYEATAQIRAWERATGRRIPIVAVTANVTKGDRERCLAAGMDGYVAKPIHTTELFRVIAELAAMPNCFN